MKSNKKREAFTLIEVIIALAIVTALSSVVTIGLMQQQRRARVDQAKIQIRNLESAVQLYYSDHGRVPTTEQGLEALASKPTRSPIPDDYPEEGYLGGRQVPLDPWQNEYIYISPGRRGQPFEIISYGSDGQPGGTGYAQEISNLDL